MESEEDKIKKFIKFIKEKLKKPPSLNPLLVELESSEVLDYEVYYGRTEVQWLRRYPDYGDDIYTHLHKNDTADVKSLKPKDSALELSSIDVDIIANIWKSVVKISCDEFVGSGLVIDKVEDGEDQGLYILTNLHLLQDQPEVLKQVTHEFKTQVKKYEKLRVHVKKRKLQNSDSRDPLNVLIEQNCDGQMVYVTKFVLDKGVCWEASAASDYMILKVPLPENCSLQMCEYHTYFCDTMPVHIFGFPGALGGGFQFQHQYAIIPAQITGKDVVGQILLSTLSTPGLSGSAIVCTGRGCAIGYLGGGFDTEVNQQYQCYGYGFKIPPYLPRMLKNSAVNLV